MLDQQQFDSELREQEAAHEIHRRTARERGRQNKRAYKAAKQLRKAATKRMAEGGWPGSSVEAVRTTRLFRSRRNIRLVRLVGDAFDGSVAEVRDAHARDDLEQPLWLGEDGQFYELNLLMMLYYPKPGEPAYNAAIPCHGVYYDYWPGAAAKLQQIVNS